MLKLAARYLDIANAAMKTSDWEGSNGVITEGSDNSANNDGIGFKGTRQRGLLVGIRLNNCL
jgi:hypothetical protein